MQYCSNCGARVQSRIPDGDNRARFVCVQCGAIHYQNPCIIAGCLPQWEDRVLLCRRAIEPRRGLWTLPAGFMENGETTMQAAARETLEEANARVEVGALHTLINLPHINQVYLLYLGRLLDLDFAPGTESLEVGLYREHEIPWEELAFPTIRQALKFYFQDRRRGRFELHSGVIKRSPGAG